MINDGPVLRIFEVRTKPNAAATLLSNFATTSAQVVKDEPGNCGYFFGQSLERDGDTVLFVSVWRDLAAIKDKFGAEWQSSYLPDGYSDLIEDCSVRHFNVSDGWHVEGL